MWKRADINPDLQYRIALCQNTSGSRWFELRSAEALESKDGSFLVTEVVPTDLLQRGDVGAIAKTVRLTNGSSFWVDAHGIWLTSEELEALESDEDIEVPWHNGIPANFAPK